MLVLLKSSPGTNEANRGLRAARDLSADLVLTQNSVYIAGKGTLEGFAGSVYAIDEDLRLRGIPDIPESVRPEGVRRIGYDELVDLMAGGEKVVGMF
jgi:sulfur relay protein TusB/DsrH